MGDSYFGRLFARGSNSRIFSANIAENEGLDTPAPIPSLPGWTVWKKGQTEIYVITHNLGLSNPAQQMHIVATPKNYNAILSIPSVDRNEFIVSTWNFNGAATRSVSCSLQYITLRRDSGIKLLNTANVTCYRG